MSKNPDEMATEVIKAWIAGKSIGSEAIARDLRVIYKAMIEAQKEYINEES